jgi:hypothetical protein
MALKYDMKGGSVVNYDAALASILTVGNAYGDNDEVVVGIMHLEVVSFGFSAASNNLTVRVLGSMDGGANYDYTLVAAFTLTVGTDLYKHIVNGGYDDVATALAPFCTHAKIQVQPAVAATHGTLSSKFSGRN